jgi:ABC-type transport system involved in multi-copper enzyme maturation permease subunit
MATAASHPAKTPRRGEAVRTAGLACLVLGGVAAGVALVLDAAEAPTWQRVPAWGLLLLSTAAVVRRGGAWLVGPVLGYELRRLARRGSTVFLARSVYLGLLLVLLVALYAAEAKDGVPRVAPAADLPALQKKLAAIGARFLEVLLLAQTAAVLLLTPAFAAGAIAEERQRRTLDFLLVSGLSSREIVLGKLLARLAPPALLLLAGLPVLALVQLLGGADPLVILGGFAIDAAAMASLGSITLFYSVSSRKAAIAVVYTYMTAAIFLLVTWHEDDVSIAVGNPFLAIRRFPEAVRGGRSIRAFLQVFGEGAWFHLMVAYVCTILTIVRLRRGTPGEAAVGVPPWDMVDVEPAACPEVGDRPLLWKELHVEHGWRCFSGRRVLTAAAALGFLLLVVWTFLFIREVEHEQLHVWFLVTGQLAACVAFVLVAIRAAGTWARERERRTLDDLLMTDLTNAELVGDKWLGSFWSLRWVWGYLGAILVLTAFAGAIEARLAPVLGIAWFVYAAFAASLGSWCSLRCRSTGRATVLTLGLLGGITAGHWLVHWGFEPLLVRDRDQLRWLKQVHRVGLTPPATLDVLGAAPERLHVHGYTERHTEEIPFAVAGVCVYGMLAVGFRARISARFARVTGRMPVGPPPRASPSTAARPLP